MEPELVQESPDERDIRIPARPRGCPGCDRSRAAAPGKTITNDMAGPPIPKRGSALTIGWMQRALDAASGAGLPAIADMLVEDIGSGSGALGEILRCTMEYRQDGGEAPGSVVVKLCSSDRRNARVARLFDMYRREYGCFRLLAPHMPIRLPTLLYGAWEEPHRFVLVLEDLRGMEAADQISGASPSQARRAIRGAADLHGRFWNKLDQPPASSFLASVRHRRRWVSQLLYLICLAPCLRRFGGLFSDNMRRLAEAYGPRVVIHMDELSSGPQTLTHGDFRLENMFFGAAGSDAFTVIDWQASGLVANGLYDVAYFMVTSVPTEVRRDIERDALEEYHSVVSRTASEDFSLADCWRRYRETMLNMLVPCVCACGGLDMTNPRMRELGETTVQRTLDAIRDLEAHEFLPGGGSPVAPAQAFPILSAGAYGVYRALYRLFGPRTQPSPT